METAAAHLRVSAHPRSLNNDNEITALSPLRVYASVNGPVVSQL